MCQICGDPIHAKGRCHSCYVYWRRHQFRQDRTRVQAVRAAIHRFEREVLARRLDDGMTST